MNLARPFKAGETNKAERRVATPETGFNRRYATKVGTNPIPAFKRRAKLMPTLRVEESNSIYAATRDQQ